MNHIPEGLDATRTPLAETMHTARLAIAAVTGLAAYSIIMLAAFILL